MKAIIKEDYIGIYDDQMNEIVGWNEDEWKEDPETVVPAIANAIKLCYTEPDKLRELLPGSIQTPK